MRLPNLSSRSALSSAVSLFRLSAAGVSIVLSGLLLTPPAISQLAYTPQTAKERKHDTAEWQGVAQHLPDRVRSTPAVLERQGDILRARRFPEDAMDFYNFALQNEGKAAVLLDKLGLVSLALKNTSDARMYFRRVVQLDHDGADGWNNLGVVESLSGRLLYAVADYERAVKLKPAQPVFRCNLAAAYFEQGDFYRARREMAEALKLDPQAFDRGDEGLGAVAHVISSEDRGRFALEMAKLYARAGGEDQMLHSLAVSSEAGIDLRHEMHRDKVLTRYASDPRVLVLMHNAQALRAPERPRLHSGLTLSSLALAGETSLDE